MGTTFLIFGLGFLLGILFIMVIGWPMTAMIPLAVLLFIRYIFTGRRGF